MPTDPRGQIRDVIAAITPHDTLHQEHRDRALTWVDSGASLWRLTAPADPDPHLVTYFLPFDASAGQMLLVHHRKAGLWLPPGVHLASHPVG